MPAMQIRAPRDAADTSTQSLGLFGVIARQVLLDRVIEVGRVTWWARANTPAELRATTDRIVATHPGVDIEDPAVGADPGVVRPGEHCVSVAMRPSRSELVEWAGGAHVVGALGAAMDAAITLGGADIRVVERVVAEPAPAQAAVRLRQRIEEPQERAHAPQGDETSWLLIVLLAALVLPPAVVFGLWRISFGDLVEGATAVGVRGAVMVAVAVVTAAGAAVLWWRVRPLPRLPREQVERKTAHPLCTVWLGYLIIGSTAIPLETLLAAARSVGTRAENLAGGALRPHMEPGWTDAAAWRQRDGITLNALEAAQLWHLPAGDDGDPRYERARYRRIAPAPDQVDHGPIVGYTE